MQLSNCELLPGVITDTKDPMKIGRIKCVIPGYVDPSFSSENTPWVRPLGMFNHQSFSKMMKGYKVWVLINKANYNEYWYFPFFELNDVAKNFLSSVYDKEQPEIFVAHNCGGNHALDTYDESNGFSTKIGQHHIDLHPDGHISLLGQQGTVDIDGSKIKIGHVSGEDNPAVLGDKLKLILDKLKDAMSKLQGVSQGMLAPLASGFSDAVEALTPSEDILSKNVTVN